MTNKNVHSEHMKRVDAVNEAKTEREHQDANLVLKGFRDGLDAAGLSPRIYMDCDLAQFARGFEHRPMCCGVFLDWKPEASD